MATTKVATAAGDFVQGQPAEHNKLFIELENGQAYMASGLANRGTRCIQKHPGKYFTSKVGMGSFTLAEKDEDEDSLHVKLEGVIYVVPTTGYLFTRPPTRLRYPCCYFNYENTSYMDMMLYLNWGFLEEVVEILQLHPRLFDPAKEEAVQHVSVLFI